MIRVGVLFPARFNLNADAANASVLVRRLKLAGVDARVDAIDSDSIAEIPVLDGLVIGSPSSSTLVDPDLPRDRLRSALMDAFVNQVPVLAVSNGFHLLGRMSGSPGVENAGLEIIPVESRFGTERHVTIGARVDSAWGELVGVENHNATVTLENPETALGTVIRGTGNNEIGLEGYHAATIWATHLHGPVLALNPEFADVVVVAIASRAGSDYARTDAIERLDSLAAEARTHLVHGKRS